MYYVNMICIMTNATSPKKAYFTKKFFLGGGGLLANRRENPDENVILLIPRPWILLLLGQNEC